jgi:hypothetical protein
MKKITKLKNYREYLDNQYDDMKSLLNKSRMLMEQEEIDIEDVDIKDVEKEREEKAREYKVSGGVIVMHGSDDESLDLTDDEKTTYQETMDDFIEQVSDLVDYLPLNVYENNVDWGGRLVKFDTEFFFSLGESNGVFITSKMAKVDQEFTETLEKLKSYYQIFSAKWSKVLANRKTTEMDKEDEPANEL